jgi:hypothetical protein
LNKWTPPDSQLVTSGAEKTHAYGVGIPEHYGEIGSTLSGRESPEYRFCGLIYSINNSNTAQRRERRSRDSSLILIQLCFLIIEPKSQLLFFSNEKFIGINYAINLHMLK